MMQHAHRLAVGAPLRSALRSTLSKQSTGFRPKFNLQHGGARFMSSINGDLASGTEPNSTGASVSSVEELLSDPATVEAVSKVAQPLIETPELGSTPPQLILSALEMVHNASGLPWWLSIVASTVAIRAALLPVLASSLRAGAILPIIQPQMTRLTDEMKANAHRPDVVQRCQRDIQDLFAKHKTNPLKAFMGPLVQMPVMVSFFFALREMHTYFPSIATGGDYWFTDLSANDPSYALPVMSALTFLAVIETSQQSAQPDPKQIIVKNVMRGLAVVMVPATSYLPSGVFVYWITSNVISVAQALVMRTAVVRKLLDMPDPASIPKPPTPPAGTGASGGVTSAFKDLVGDSTKTEAVSPPRAPVKTFSNKRRVRGGRRGRGSGDRK